MAGRMHGMNELLAFALIDSHSNPDRLDFDAHRNTRIPIKVNLTVYNEKKPEVQTSYVFCQVKCSPEDINLFFDNGTQMIEISTQGFDYRLQLSESNHTSSTRHDINQLRRESYSGSTAAKPPQQSFPVESRLLLQPQLHAVLPRKRN
uniref:Uncharacterized protein n=1 Tax=Acrobeloides nanus TaxID=290746 RepID=A0A914CJH0_9BILA